MHVCVVDCLPRFARGRRVIVRTLWLAHVPATSLSDVELLPGIADALQLNLQRNLHVLFNGRVARVPCTVR